MDRRLRESGWTCEGRGSVKLAVTRLEIVLLCTRDEKTSIVRGRTGRRVERCGVEGDKPETSLERLVEAVGQFLVIDVAIGDVVDSQFLTVTVILCQYLNERSYRIALTAGIRPRPPRNQGLE